MLKTIFLGNSDFCIPTLEALARLTHVVAIITGLDKVVTNRNTYTQKPLPKIYGEEHNIPVLQPKSLQDEDFIKTVQNLNPDMMVIISYGKILPAILFNIPHLGTFNLHASLLPAYRGASPIQEALLHNDSITGITLQKINEKMDDGNIYWTKPYNIPVHIFYPELRSELAQLAATTLCEFLLNYADSGMITSPKPQLGEPSYCGKIKKEDGLISFKELSAQEIYNKFRAFYSWPQIFFHYKNKTIKLEKIALISKKEQLQASLPGTVIQADKIGLIIQAKSGYLNILQVRPENKKSQDYISFINGYTIKKEECLC